MDVDILSFLCGKQFSYCSNLKNDGIFDEKTHICSYSSLSILFRRSSKILMSTPFPEQPTNIMGVDKLPEIKFGIYFQ